MPVGGESIGEQPVGTRSRQNNNVVEILVFTTGGTIEKTYDEGDGSLENRASVIERQISPLLRLPYAQLTIKPLMCKDSLAMDDHDRLTLAQAIAAVQDQGHPVVVLHGTDTMDQSARYCQQFLAPVKIPIVFTGAMKPIGFRDSDALQNVTEALMVCKIIGPGVYVSFHNRLYRAEEVRKNRRLHTFEEIV